MGFLDRLQHAWNVFTNNRDPTIYQYAGTSSRPDRARATRGYDRSIINSINTRISIDAAALDIQHCIVDENENFLEKINSGINNCLNIEANIDQSGRAFRQDMFYSILDEGCIAAVPIETTVNPSIGSLSDILSIRLGPITQWYPDKVTVRLYNDKTGQKQEVTVPKKTVAILENPLYSIMNEPNSILSRLNRKMNILDIIDEQSGSGKLDMIIQMPYTIRTEARKAQAEKRVKDIEMQLTGSKFGIAYTDATEKVIQLNRSLENNIMKQVEYLTGLLFSQLGMTEEVFNGTADEKIMLNYYNRTIEPLVSMVCDELIRKFLTKNARTRGQSFKFFRNRFSMSTTEDLATLADKLTRNEILSSNEVRAIIGYKPSDDPRADQLVNKNIKSDSSDQMMMPPAPEDPYAEEEANQMPPLIDPFGEEDQNGS